MCQAHTVMLWTRRRERLIEKGPIQEGFLEEAEWKLQVLERKVWEENLLKGEGGIPVVCVTGMWGGGKDGAPIPGTWKTMLRNVEFAFNKRVRLQCLRQVSGLIGRSHAWAAIRERNLQ